MADEAGRQNATAKRCTGFQVDECSTLSLTSHILFEGTRAGCLHARTGPWSAHVGGPICPPRAGVFFCRALCQAAVRKYVAAKAWQQRLALVNPIRMRPNEVFSCA